MINVGRWGSRSYTWLMLEKPIMWELLYQSATSPMYLKIHKGWDGWQARYVYQATRLTQQTVGSNIPFYKFNPSIIQLIPFYKFNPSINQLIDLQKGQLSHMLEVGFHNLTHDSSLNNGVIRSEPSWNIHSWNGVCADQKGEGDKRLGDGPNCEWAVNHATAPEMWNDLPHVLYASYCYINHTVQWLTHVGIFT